MRVEELGEFFCLKMKSNPEDFSLEHIPMATKTFLIQIMGYFHCKHEAFEILRGQIP